MLPGIIAARALWRLGNGMAHGPVRRPMVVRQYSSTRHVTSSRREAKCRVSASFERRRYTTPRASENDDSSATTRYGPGSDTQAHSEDSGWTPIYRFKGVQLAGAVSRIKIVQTVLVVGMVPVFSYMYQNNVVTFEVATASAVIGGFALVMLYIMSGVLRHCVGVISITSDHKLIRVGYLTFWGRRRNVTIPIDDVVPLAEGNISLNTEKLLPPYVHLKTYSDDKLRLYLPLRRIEIVDEALFEQVFGALPHAKAKKRD